MNKKWIISVLSTLIFFFSHIVQATLIRVSDGTTVIDLSTESSLVLNINMEAEDEQLLGAFNVDVSGILYDVEFVEGSFIDVFGQLGLIIDFDAVNQFQARAFSRALSDFVFLDNEVGLFDSMPELTHGCSTTNCIVHTPYALIENDRFKSIIFINDVGIPLTNFNILNNNDSIVSGSLNTDVSLSNIPASVLADWSLTSERLQPSDGGINAVPEPSALVLLLLAIASLMANRRRT